MFFMKVILLLIENAFRTFIEKFTILSTKLAFEHNFLRLGVVNWSEKSLQSTSNVYRIKTENPLKHSSHVLLIFIGNIDQ